MSVDVFDDIEHIPGHLEEMDEEAQLDWANIVMGNSDPIAKALDIMGWKIIPKDDLPNSRWPFDASESGCACPDWCENLASVAYPFPPVQGRA